MNRAVKTSIIVAASDNDVISQDGKIPWDLPEDRQRFRALTVGHVIIVGNRTQESIINSIGHVLPDRLTIVLSRQLPSRSMSIHNGRDVIMYQSSIRSGISSAHALERFAGHKEVFIIGGGEVYSAALPYVDHIYLTRVYTDIPKGISMPAGWLDGFYQNYSLHQTNHPRGELDYSFELYERKMAALSPTDG